MINYYLLIIIDFKINSAILIYNFKIIRNLVSNIKESKIPFFIYIAEFLF